MRDPLLQSIHEQLLLSYTKLMYTRSLPHAQRNAFIHELSSTFLTTGAVWDLVFTSESSLQEAEEGILKSIYEKWREKHHSQAVNAALAWGTWLLEGGRGKEASDAIMSTRCLLEDCEEIDLERRWSEVLDGDGQKS